MSDKETPKLSRWKDDDIAALIPPLKPLLKDPSKTDVAQMQQIIDVYIGEQYARLEQLPKSETYQRFASQSDPHALADLLDELAMIHSNTRNTLVFVQAASMHYGSDAFNNTIEPVTAIVGQVGMVLEQMSEAVLSPLSKLSGEQVAALIAAEPRLEAYRPKIERAHTAPGKGLQNANLENNEGYQRLLARRLDLLDNNRSVKERKEIFAELLTGVMLFKQQHIKAQGFKNTKDYFSYLNAAPVDMVDLMTDASDARMMEYIDELKKVNELRERKIPNADKYSLEEAQEIIVSTYEQLGPEFGKIARKAFDEGWVHLGDNVPNPHVIPVHPTRQNEDQHPFIASHFNGKIMDIIALSHEMGHAISYYLAGKKQNSLAADASMMVQESFSHMGEALLQKELMKRAEDDYQRARIDFNFLAKECDALTIAPMVRIEEDIYKKLEEKGSPLTFKELNGIYHKHMPMLRDDVGDVTDMPAVWNLMLQQPHNLTVYPATKIMATALEQAREKEPEAFAREYHAIMEAGAHVTVSELWDRLLGPDRFEQQVQLNNSVADIEDRIADLKARLEAMPDQPKEKPLTHAQQVEAKIRAQEDIAKAAADNGTVGSFTGIHAKKQLSERASPSARVKSTAGDWATSVQSSPDASERVRQ